MIQVSPEEFKKLLKLLDAINDWMDEILKSNIQAIVEKKNEEEK